MAKKKKKPGPKPSELGRKTERIVILSRPDWKTWLDEFVKAERTTIPAMVDSLIAAHAASRKFRPPPER